MYSVRPNLLLRKFYPAAIWRIPPNLQLPSEGRACRGRIYLTFDDGPIPEVTPWVLEQLKKYNAKATFFCIGSNVEKHPYLFRQIVSEDHAVGNHTQHHLNGWKTKTSDYIADTEKCSLAVQPATRNHEPMFFRPPYGRMKLSQYNHLRSKYRIVMWDVLSGDFDQNISPDKCLRNVFSKTRDGSIVVFHDSLKAKNNLYHALPQMLKHFSSKGFTFHSLQS